MLVGAAQACRPFQLEVAFEYSFDFQRLDSLYINHDGGSGSLPRNEQSFLDLKGVASVENGGRLGAHLHRAHEGLSRDNASFQVKLQMEVAQDLERIHPTFEV